MEFIKLGKIFTPQNHNLFTKLGDFAQSPQALVMKDRVRVFFSTREKEREGMFVSYPCYVDFDHSFSHIKGISQKPLIPTGERGTFDEHGIFPISPLRVGKKLFAYTTGWTRRKSVATDSGIGLAISDDGGENFMKHGKGPVMGASVYEPFLVSDGFVLLNDNVFHMWYIFGQRWIKNEKEGKPERVYKIAHAVSLDGIEWKRSGGTVIENTLGDNECQALPCVLKYNDIFVLVYCYRHATDFRNNPHRGYRLGCAISTDLKNWSSEEMKLIDMIEEDDWDAGMQCYPNIFHLNGEIYLLYNGNQFGKFGFGIARLSQKN
jgi:hypothetical protein